MKELEILKQEKEAEEGYSDEESSESHSSEPMPYITPKIEVEPGLEKFIKLVVKADSECLMVEEHDTSHLLEMQTHHVVSWI